MMGLNDDDDENLNTAESSDDERSGYPTLPVDGIGSRPSAGSLRHVSPLRIAFQSFNNNYNISINRYNNKIIKYLNNLSLKLCGYYLQ